MRRAKVKMRPMDSTRRNWSLWAGLLVSLIALLTYVFGFQTTRRIFWLSVALFILAAWLLVKGINRARSQPGLYRGRRAGPILATLSLLLAGLFGFMTFMVSKHFPEALNAPKVGDKAPEFALLNTDGSPVTLGQLLSSSGSSGTASGSARSPRGILLVFYRGYW